MLTDKPKAPVTRTLVMGGNKISKVGPKGLKFVVGTKSYSNKPE